MSERVKMLSLSRPGIIEFALEIPTAKAILRAHEVYAAKELRGTDVYRDALENVQQGFQSTDLLRAAQAIAALIKSWNWNHLRFHPDKTARLGADVQKLIVADHSLLRRLRLRSITSLTAADRPIVLRLFSEFAEKFGPVGSAKALNLIGPLFFPFWDNEIAARYGVARSAYGYAAFMVMSLEQVERLMRELPDGPPLLKTLDEYNYCKFTKRWIP